MGVVLGWVWGVRIWVLCGGVMGVACGIVLAVYIVREVGELF